MNQTAFSKQETLGLKGLLSVLVVFCHLRSYISVINNSAVLSSAFVAFGYVSVALFFFISGYGLGSQYDNKKDYMKCFMQNRVLTTYVKYILFVFGYALLFLISDNFNLKQFALSFVWGNTIVINGWYFQVTLIFYILFWLVFRTKYNANLKISMLFAVSVAYCAICIIIGIESHWYQSVICLPFGVWYYYILNGKFEKANKLREKNIFWISISKLVIGIFLILLRICVPTNVYIGCILLTVGVVLMFTGAIDLKFMKVMPKKIRESIF